jgi:Domain of Unknown Function (DUF1259)
MRKIALLSLLVTVSSFAATPLETIIGRPGTVIGNVTKFAFPRTDLAIDVDGIRIKPALALGSWAAFNGTMVMGDLVLTEDEVNDVISALAAGGIETSAVHNHLLHESPRVVYVHFEGHGDASAMARALSTALGQTKTPMTVAAPPAAPAPLDLPTEDIDRIMKATGKANGGVDQFSFPRPEKIMMNGMEIPPAMGVATAINFQPTGSGRAVVTGDFVMTSKEVNAVIRALRGGHIKVTALHSHMLDEQPRLFFMHFWGNDVATALATTLRSALDAMKR